jgi:hypothetical protein
VCLSRPAATGTLKNDGQMSCCVSGVDGGRDLKGATAKKKRIKEKRGKRNNRWCLVQPTIRSNHEPQKEMRGNSVSPVTRHWTDIIQSFLALSFFALCVRCSELLCALVCSLEEEEVVIWFRAKFLFRENQPKKLPKKRRRRRVKEDAAADLVGLRHVESRPLAALGHAAPSDPLSSRCQASTW